MKAVGPKALEDFGEETPVLPVVVLGEDHRIEAQPEIPAAFLAYLEVSRLQDRQETKYLRTSTETGSISTN